jgi:hypothetical protein
MGPAPQPRVTTVTIDGNKFDADSASMGFSTAAAVGGAPLMGTFLASVEVVVDIHDDVNMPFSMLRDLFELAKIVTRDKIKDIQLDFWKDESRQDVICSYKFEGWISHFQTHSAGGGNHTLVMSLQPKLDQQNYPVIDMSN